MRRAAALACLAMLSTPIPAPVAAQITLSAADLLENCTNPQGPWVDFCNGFFQAAHDYGALHGEICAPADVTRSDLVDLYARYAPTLLQDTPDVARATGLVVAVSIIAAEYPCDR